MSGQTRTWLAVITLAVYAGLLAVKVVRLRRAPDPAEKRRFQFDLVRQALDCSLLQCFLLTGLCPTWFALFSETPLGYCAGCYILIILTLLISVFVDWIPIRREKARRMLEKPTFPEFLLRQLWDILRICFALTLVWGVFLVMEETGTALGIRILLALAALLLLRVLLALVGKNRKKEPNHGGT